MTRRIVFAGGVQAQALAKAYRLHVAAERDDDVFFVGAASLAREAARRLVAGADIVVAETDEAGDALAGVPVPTRAEVIGVPVVVGDFLWPFAGAPHPANRGTDAVPDGPYPADFGDRRLDSLLAEGMGPDEAVDRYAGEDLAALVDLDGLLRRRLEVQSALDTRTGFDLADVVGDAFRGGDLFATRHRLRPALFRRVAGRLFARMGADASRAAALEDGCFPAGAMPVHPSVLRHFGMTAPSAEHRYPVLDEGAFDFVAYCRRYVRCAWNERLHEALALVAGDPAAALPLLRLALRESPESAAGQAALAAAERALAAGGNLRQASASWREPRTTDDAAAVLPGFGAASTGLTALPGLLGGAGGLAGADDGPFSGMEEIMPPPPVRPVLPPEPDGAPARRGFLARLFGGT